MRGAFTGAVRDKAGLFEVAGNGTLFLDEIGEVAPTVQAKLLRALQEREIRRVGAERNIKVNARVVAATNRDLRAAVAAGTFREDLYFRLGAFVITVPPLRERREDIPPLVHDFLRRAAARVKKDVKTVSADAMTALMNYRWPGNVRELEHAIERAVIVARGTSVEVRELPPEVSQKTRLRDDRRQPRSAGTGTRHDRARARAVSRQSAPGGRRAEDQHRHALAKNEAVRAWRIASDFSPSGFDADFVLKPCVSVRNALTGSRKPSAGNSRFLASETPHRVWPGPCLDSLSPRIDDTDSQPTTRSTASSRIRSLRVTLVMDVTHRTSGAPSHATDEATPDMALDRDGRAEVVNDGVIDVSRPIERRTQAHARPALYYWRSRHSTASAIRYSGRRAAGGPCRSGTLLRKRKHYGLSS